MVRLPPFKLSPLDAEIVGGDVCLSCCSRKTPLVHSRSAQAFSFDHAWAERVHTDLARAKLLARHHSQQCANGRNLSFPS